MSVTTARPGPLAGVTVLDLTQFLSGPYGTQLLADLGARIIKVEPPYGDSSRAIRSDLINDESAYYASINRSKQSIALDLKNPRGREIVLALAAQADLVIENFRPGTMARLGLDFDELRRVNPAVVLCSISGFGQDGPYRDRPAYDVVVQAMSGGMSLTGPIGGDPVRAGIPIGDLCAGLCAAVGGLAALLEARTTGRGRHLDVSMLDVQLSMLTYQATYFLNGGEVPGTQGRDHVSIPTYRSFRCSDGRDIVIAANTERMWRGLCRALDLELLVDDPRFSTIESRLIHRDELVGLLSDRFALKPALEWDTLLAAEDVPASPLNDLDDALNSLQCQARSMVMHLDDDAGQPIPVIASPMRFVGEAALAAVRPPRLGEHTIEILRGDLGRSDQDIAGLAAEGAVVATGGEP